MIIILHEQKNQSLDRILMEVAMIHEYIIFVFINYFLTSQFGYTKQYVYRVTLSMLLAVQRFLDAQSFDFRVSSAYLQVHLSNEL